MSAKLWKLHIEGDRHPSFIPDDLGFFADKFCCKSLSSTWVVPPAKLVDTSKKLADFYSWGQTLAPLVSARAKRLISAIPDVKVEFLEFHQIKSQPTFVMNVLACEDILDLSRSSLQVFEERFIFRANVESGITPIFKCPGIWGHIFVSTAFGEMMVTNGLRGAVLGDPSEPTMPLILKKASVNRFPGLGAG